VWQVLIVQVSSGHSAASFPVKVSLSLMRENQLI
jgi:hypothetical protein